jgi:hypothetical protein
MQGEVTQLCSRSLGVMFPTQLSWICPANPQTKQQELKKSIASMIDLLDSEKHRPTHLISRLAHNYGIKIRRLYDLVNVLASVGCCRRTGPDQLVWLGKSQILPALKTLRQERGIDDESKSLCDLFPVSGCVGLSNLTVNLLLLFSALRSDRVDLRFAGNLFSRQTARYKSTLCKLYQINYTLCAAGVSNRTSQVCEIMLLSPYVDFRVVPSSTAIPSHPLLLETLLNHHDAEPASEFVNHRRAEIADLFERSFAARTSLVHSSPTSGECRGCLP